MPPETLVPLVSAMQTVSEASAPANGLAPGASQLLVDLSQLLEDRLAGPAFFAEFLQRLVPELGALAGAIWTRTPADHFKLEQCWSVPGVEAAALHREGDRGSALLRRVVRAGRPLWVPPHASRSADGETGPAD